MCFQAPGRKTFSSLNHVKIVYLFSGPQTKQWKFHFVTPSPQTSVSGQRYSSWTWMETVVSTLTLLMNRTHTLCPLGSSDPCTSSSLRTRVSVRTQPVCVLSQAESGRVHANLSAGSSVWSPQPVPQSAAGTVCVCGCVFMCVSVFLLTVTVDPPQLDLRSGRTSTLLDVVNRAQPGTSHSVSC